MLQRGERDGWPQKCVQGKKLLEVTGKMRTEVRLPKAAASESCLDVSYCLQPHERRGHRGFPIGQPQIKRRVVCCCMWRSQSLN